MRVIQFIHTMNTATAPSFTPETKLGDIVVARPSLARVFERLGLDYCCGGQQTLTAACARKGLDPHTVVVILTAAEAESAAPIEADTAGMTLS